MVFEKKKGRPKGTFTTNYTNMDPDEQAQYHHEKVKGHRKARKSNVTPNQSTASISKSTPSTSRSRGRKKSDEGSQTPRTRKR